MRLPERLLVARREVALCCGCVSVNIEAAAARTLEQSSTVDWIERAPWGAAWHCRRGCSKKAVTATQKEEKRMRSFETATTTLEDDDLKLL